jgi:transitional endoplasmic reticulum ATPase
MELTVKPVVRASAEDGAAFVTSATMEELGLSDGSFVRLVGPGGDGAVARVRGGGDYVVEATVRIDRRLRRAVGVDVGETVAVEAADVADATGVTVALPPAAARAGPSLSFRDSLVGRGVVAGQTLFLAFDADVEPASHTADGVHRRPVRVVETDPTGPVVVREWTTISVSPDAAGGEGVTTTSESATAGARAANSRGRASLARPTGAETNGRSDPPGGRTGHRPATYDDVGGLDDELAQIRETVELPLRHPEIFDRVGVDPPTGVLLYGPPGTGKTLVARAVATETDIHFETVSGPTIVSKYAGETEARLREVFEAAADRPAAIVFIDELDSIAAKRGGSAGEAGDRAVAQLLSLMDGVDGDGRTVVVGTTNRPDAVDPALRRPGRFDREVEIGVPDRDDRAEILAVHARDLPLADGVDLDAYAEQTHGFVGADLEHLLREAAMRAVRRLGLDGSSDSSPVDPAALDELSVTGADLDAALRSAEPSALREVFVEIPEVSWADVGGLDDVKARLRETVEWPLTHAEAFERVGLSPATGVLLYGPPGTGKTLLAKAVASEASSNFISVKGPELLDKYVGESEKGIREVFAKARENAPTVVFFDEIDAIAGERGGSPSSGVTERVVSQLLTELDGLEALEDVVVVATTNRPTLLDDALLRPGRFDRHVHVGVPDEAARREILAIHSDGRPLADDVDVGDLATRTEGYVGADLEAVCREAAAAAVRDHVASGGPVDDIVLTADHFDRALDEVDPSPDGDARFAEFEATAGDGLD